MNIDCLTMTDAAILKELGIRIASLRLQKNLRQIDVSKQSGLSLDTVKRLEKGQGKLSSLVSVLRALNALYVLNNFIPPVSLDPISIAKMKGKVRQRGRGRK